MADNGPKRAIRFSDLPAQKTRSISKSLGTPVSTNTGGPFIFKPEQIEINRRTKRVGLFRKRDIELFDVKDVSGKRLATFNSKPQAQSFKTKVVKEIKLNDARNKRNVAKGGKKGTVEKIASKTSKQKTKSGIKKSGIGITKAGISIFTGVSFDDGGKTRKRKTKRLK